MRKKEMKSNTEQNPFDIINMYYDEWKYRHENFWKRLTQFTVITFFTTSLPVTFRIFGNLELPNIPIVFFPVCGAVLALLSLFFCLSENSRLAAVDLTIKGLVQEQFGDNFSKKLLPSGKFEKLFHWRIGIWFPIAITALQIALAILVIWMIFTNYI